MVKELAKCLNHLLQSFEENKAYVLGEGDGRAVGLVLELKDWILCLEFDTRKNYRKGIPWRNLQLFQMFHNSPYTRPS